MYAAGAVGHVELKSWKLHAVQEEIFCPGENGAAIACSGSVDWYGCVRLPWYASAGSLGGVDVRLEDKK